MNTLQQEPQLSAEIEKRFNAFFPVNETLSEFDPGGWLFWKETQPEIKHFLATALEEQRATLLAELESWITKKDWRVMCCNKDYPSAWWQTSFGRAINAIIGKNVAELRAKVQEMKGKTE